MTWLRHFAPRETVTARVRVRDSSGGEGEGETREESQTVTRDALTGLSEDQLAWVEPVLQTGLPSLLVVMASLVAHSGASSSSSDPSAGSGAGAGSGGGGVGGAVRALLSAALGRPDHLGEWHGGGRRLLVGAIYSAEARAALMKVGRVGAMYEQAAYSQH